MSNSLAGLRHQLKGAAQLGSVVRAMKAVAASSIGQYEAAVQALESYQRTVDRALALCLRDSHDHGVGDGKLDGMLVLGSDQGLVGRFNETIGELALQRLQEPKRLWVVGERVAQYLEAAGKEVYKRFPVPNSVAAISSLVSDIQLSLAGCGEIWVLHNRSLAAPRYEPCEQRLLPLDAQWRRTLLEQHWPGKSLPEILGTATAALEPLVHEHLFIRLYKACAESLASENASRLEAMQRAEKNIAGVTTDLQRSINKLRQSSIDAELFDLVSSEMPGNQPARRFVQPTGPTG